MCFKYSVQCSLIQLYPCPKARNYLKPSTYITSARCVLLHVIDTPFYNPVCVIPASDDSLLSVGSEAELLHHLEHCEWAVSESMGFAE